MKNGKTRLLLIALLAVFALILVACNQDDASTDPVPETPLEGGEEAKQEDDDTPESDENDGMYSYKDFRHLKDDGTPIQGGHLNFGLVSDTPFQGTLNPLYASGVPDNQVMGFFSEGMLTWDKSFAYSNDGAATFEIDPDDNRIWTFTIRDNVNWHDGVPVTAHDWEFAHYVLADPDYDGVRFNASLRNVEGIVEYHNGEADTISGIEVLDDKTLRITYVRATPSLITGGVWTSAIPKHIFENIPVSEMAAHNATRVNPIGFGPYILESIVPGESVTYVKNENYWRGEPALDRVTLRVVSPSVVAEAMKAGEFDVLSGFPADQFPENADLSNITWLGDIYRGYDYIGFKLGTWDSENNVVNYDPENSKVGNKYLRQALAHAIDSDTIGRLFYHGLRWDATTLIPPSHSEFQDETNPGRPYDPEKAKQLLDEAGYVDVDGDGFREDPDGNKLVLNYIGQSGGDIAEPLARYYLQAWAEVGINVQLLDGRLHEFNSFYNRVGDEGNDDPEVDIFGGAWQVGINIDPSGLYGREAIYNFSRWASEENDRLLAEGLSEEAFDVQKRIEIYNEWQALITEEVPVFPTTFRTNLRPVNNRVTNYTIGDNFEYRLWQWAVTSDTPEVAN